MRLFIYLHKEEKKRKAAAAAAVRQRNLTNAEEANANQQQLDAQPLIAPRGTIVGEAYDSGPSNRYSLNYGAPGTLTKSAADDFDARAASRDDP